MNSWLLLRAMVTKELRSFLRERNQWMGLILPIVVCLIVLCIMGYTYRTAGQEDPRIRALATAMQEWSREGMMALRWGSIGVGVAAAMFLALGYLVPTILASFAGEKENRTLEVVLACPVPDTRLFVLKCASVLLPMMAMGYGFVLVVWGAAEFWFHEILAQLPVAVWAYTLLASVPVMLLIATVFVGLGAAISVRSDTLKGAAHVLGGVVMLFLFIIPYSIPLVLKYEPARRVLAGWAKAWAGLPFGTQYVLVLLVLAVPAALLLALGRALFRRDRMLA